MIELSEFLPVPEANLSFFFVVDEIVRKIDNILSSSPKSDSWREYQRIRDRRSKKS